MTSSVYGVVRLVLRVTELLVSSEDAWEQKRMVYERIEEIRKILKAEN